MKSKFKKIIVLVIIFSIVVMSTAVASPATSFTWTINSKGKWTKTQDAYLPETTLVELQLDTPEDLFIEGNILYVADTGNKRILKYDIEKNQVIESITIDAFKNPRGVYVTENNIFVADSGAEAIFKLRKDGTLEDTFGRPTDIAFGATAFKPVKIAVDTKNNMYIIGEGVLDGMIQLSNGGKFLGFFASNKVELSFIQEMQDRFFTEEQLDNLQSRVPITMTNVFVDHENTVYSTTIGYDAKNRLAKHNTAGGNTFNEYLLSPDDLIDVYVDSDGVVYAASLYGLVWVYTDDGMFIHAFGGNHQTEDIAGLFTNLNSIAVDDTGRIWAADSSTSYIQSFVPTEYSEQIYAALKAFNEGEYLEAEALWLEILKKNQMLRLAHDGLGKIYLYTERYESAMKHLEIANNKYYYSEAYWEVRNVWLQDHLSASIIGMIIFIIFMNIIKYAHKKKKILAPISKGWQKIRSVKVIDDVLFITDFFRHPIDSYYDLKIGKRGTVLSASILYFGFFALYLHSYIGRAFLFSVGPIEEIDFNAVILGFFAVSLLFIYTNYLVTSIKDGDGTLKDIFKLVAYACGPLMLSLLSVTVLSYVLTYNEEFFIKLIELAGLVWFAVNLLLGLQEVHQYSTRTALQSILFSVIFMLVIAIVLLIVILMGEQVYDFFEVIVREVIRNVT